MNDVLVTRLKSIVGNDNVKINEPMKNHTTFRIGGPAQMFITPESAGQIQDIVALCRQESCPMYIIGNGSNLLVGDDGVQGVVMSLYNKFSQYSIDGETITVQAGMSLMRLSVIAANEGLGGMEFASGIPGSVGGAVYMNAGAYGGQMADIVTEATVIDENNNIKVLSNKELEFGYRTSYVAKNNLIVVSVRLKLTKGDESTIKEKMADLAEQRKLKQPLEYPSAGSTFKRPEGYYAGKLISDAGLKGYSVGGAQVSEKHAGFVINTGNATASDVIALTDYVKQRVYEENGVELELEVKKLGL